MLRENRAAIMRKDREMFDRTDNIAGCHNDRTV